MNIEYYFERLTPIKSPYILNFRIRFSFKWLIISHNYYAAKDVFRLNVEWNESHFRSFFKLNTEQLNIQWDR